MVFKPKIMAIAQGLHSNQFDTRQEALQEANSLFSTHLSKWKSMMLKASGLERIERAGRRAKNMAEKNARDQINKHKEDRLG